MKNIVIKEDKIKTFRWLSYVSFFQLLVFFMIPIFLVPIEYVLYIEILSALTLGLIFGLFFLGVNIYGLFVDKRRRKLYVVIIILVCVWIVWSVISWLYIEHMDYLLSPNYSKKLPTPSSIFNIISLIA